MPGRNPGRRENPKMIAPIWQRERDEKPFCAREEQYIYITQPIYGETPERPM
jgi:hypothetical protein